MRRQINQHMYVTNSSFTISGISNTYSDLKIAEFFLFKSMIKPEVHSKHCITFTVITIPFKYLLAC